MKQYVVTPAAGKRLVAKAIANHATVKAALSGAIAELVSGGGVSGAEGSVWLAVSGNPEQEKKAQQLFKDVINEPQFSL